MEIFHTPLSRCSVFVSFLTIRAAVTGRQSSTAMAVGMAVASLLEDRLCSKRYTVVCAIILRGVAIRGLWSSVKAAVMSNETLLVLLCRNRTSNFC